ncbi:hypothetical protein V6N11_076674 [Hibiscus sabdariffa]|uniref:Uncharacterized protein n=1 Tax=Hibiscus sabdariffa TaxID=183260 RepID=A0ABR2A497_9ROSI
MSTSPKFSLASSKESQTKRLRILMLLAQKSENAFRECIFCQQKWVLLMITFLIPPCSGTISMESIKFWLERTTPGGSMDSKFTCLMIPTRVFSISQVSLTTGTGKPPSPTPSLDHSSAKISFTLPGTG